MVILNEAKRPSIYRRMAVGDANGPNYEFLRMARDGEFDKVVANNKKDKRNGKGSTP